MKTLLFTLMLVLFSSLAMAGNTSIGDEFVGYSAISITSMDGLIGGDNSNVVDAVIIDSDSKSYSDNYTILQTKLLTTLDTDKTGIGVIHTTGLSYSLPMTHFTLNEVGWRK